MKLTLQKITFIISAFILMIGCSTFKNEKRLHILHFKNSSGEKGITTLNYDESNFNFGAKWELLNGSRWSKNYHNYDLNGNLVLKYREFSDSLISYNWYTNNENNQLLKEKFFRSDRIHGETYYNYDEKGLLINMDCQGLNGWLYGQIEFTYNENGQKTGASINKNGNKIGHIDYEYKDGLLIKEFWDFNQRYSQTLTYEYEEYEKSSRLVYPSSNVYITNVYNYKVILEEYDYNNQGGGPSHFEYDDNGKLLKKVFTRADGLKTITDFEYNEKGVLLKSIRHYNAGETGIFNYSYNGNKRLVEKTFSLPNNVEGYEKYEYDSKMQLIKCELKNFDTWITGRIDFEYDENGNLSIGNFRGDYFDAKIDFTFDKNNNVVKYHWTFENDKGSSTQTYNFTYEIF